MKYAQGYKGQTAAGPVRGGMPVKGPGTIGIGISNPVRDIGTGGSGGMPRRMKKGGSVSSASKRADGCATKGKTKGKMV